ncbi:hypothetical protein ACLOJK_033860 [Asimina triloba]
MESKFLLILGCRISWWLIGIEEDGQQSLVRQLRQICDQDDGAVIKERTRSVNQRLSVVDQRSVAMEDSAVVDSSGHLQNLRGRERKTKRGPEGRGREGGRAELRMGQRHSDERGCLPVGPGFSAVIIPATKDLLVNFLV